MLQKLLICSGDAIFEKYTSVAANIQHSIKALTLEGIEILQSVPSMVSLDFPHLEQLKLVSCHLLPASSYYGYKAHNNAQYCLWHYYFSH
jgi:hypothetical protein